jgi:hypothetical protein
MKPHFAIRFAELLASHQVPGAHLESVSVDEASRLRDLPSIVERLLPERRIHFDAECIGDGDDLERVVGYFADAAQPDWQLAELSGDLDFDAGRGTIEFEVTGIPYRWEFEQTGDWVSRELIELLARFARSHLPGDFVELPTPDQCYCAVYLKRPAAEDLSKLLEEYKQEFS